MEAQRKVAWHSERGISHDSKHLPSVCRGMLGRTSLHWSHVFRTARLIYEQPRPKRRTGQ